MSHHIASGALLKGLLPLLAGLSIACGATGSPNLNDFAAHWSVREQQAHNAEPPADEDYQPERWLEEEEKSRQNPRDPEARDKDKDSKDKNSERQSSGKDSRKDGKNPDATGQWVLVLSTFTDGDHAAAAARMVQQLPQVAPQVRGAFVHTTTKGSMVVYGDYDGRDDPRAEKDQQRIKSISRGNRQVFKRVILTRIDFRADGQLHPHDLLSARRAHPKVDPLYTLDVALWDDFGAGKLPYDQIKRKAESFASSLRQQGHEAYFYHDEANQRSIVTVGLFDRRAINPISGLFSADVELLMKKFPVRLVNGEELREFIDKYNPSLGARPQSPKLVLVPAA